jgi:hypothetical protein
MDEMWELVSKYSVLSDYNDEVYTTVINKQMSNITGITYSGEKNSQYITFIIDRYYDGIDLSEKLINICYKINNTDKGGSDAPVNVYRNDYQIKFGWVIPESATSDEYSLSIGILVTGKQYDKDYVFKTNTSNYKIQKGFICGDGIAEPDDNWFEQFLIQVDNKVANATKDINEKVDDAISQKVLDLQQYNVVQILSDGNIRLYYDETQSST